MKIRVGIPLTGGKLVTAARENGYPVLFSANAFFTPYPKGHPRAGSFKKFKDIDLEQFAGLDAALDSAGYVAAVRYGDYRWTPEDYMTLASSFPWAWYASMDLCVELEVASDKPLRILRLAATAQLLGRLNRLADERGMHRPMPVVQGWTADEYVRCLNWLPLREIPSLIGVGSVCRRSLHGPAGINAIVRALDEVLPAHVQLHLFGVKSTAMGRLANHPRIASVDSMAWDFGARVAQRTGRTMDVRIAHMKTWQARQQSIAEDALAQGGDDAATGRQAALFPESEFRVSFAVPSHESVALEALALTWADLLLETQVEYADAVVGAQRGAYPLLGRIRNYGIVDACMETAAEFDGFEQNLLAVAEANLPRLHADVLAAIANRDAEVEEDQAVDDHLQPDRCVAA